MTFRYTVVTLLIVVLLAPHRLVEAKRRQGVKKKRTKVATSVRKKRAKRDRWPPMRLENVNTHEKLTVRLYDRRGYTIKSSVRRLDRLMRCHHTNKRRRMHWRLIRNLYKISRHYKGRLIRIYSGYRATRVSRLKRGYHTRGMAVDFTVDGISNKALRDYLMGSFKKTGVGYYPNSSFVHLDVRRKRAFWVDLSGRGEEPVYVPNPFEYLKRQRLHASRLNGQLPRHKKYELVKGPDPVGPDPLGTKQVPNPPQKKAGPQKEQTKVKRGPVSNLRGAP